MLSEGTVNEPFAVHPYNIRTLLDLMAQKAHADQRVIDRKPQAEYFQSYFEHLDAKTILVENDYIDRDFLEDYAAYYVRCFHLYDRKCTRFHFFRSPFTKDCFDSLLAGDEGPLTPDTLRDSYLGFVVVRPLPQTIIGRTCLRSYEADGGRSYPITRRYKANLFGIELVIKDTLAFQEQDHVVAACATSALWSAFHGTGTLFHHAIPSPVEITKSAGINLSGGSRNLPNTGLRLDQMAHAIRAMGLEPFLVKVDDEFILRNTLYGYLRGHVPVLMLVQLFDIYADSSASPKYRGAHAIAVTGFGTHEGCVTGNKYGFRSRACKINRIYAHDDGVGPFARMCLDGQTVKQNMNGRIKETASLSTSWRTQKDERGMVRAVPEYVLVPLYHKIRIPYERVQDAAIQFDRLIETLRELKFLPLPEQLEWDIYLTTVNEFKETFFNSPHKDKRCQILLKSLPKFLWRAVATCNNQSVLDLLFDATDIEQGKCFVHAMAYDQGLQDIFQTIVESSQIEKFLGDMPAWNILRQFRRSENA